MSSKYEMTQEQQEIFDYRPLDMVITAPAGCGKTEVLAYRAKGLLDRENFTGNGRMLLILTFTNQSRDNIDERLRKYIRIESLKRHITVSNFHGLASRIIAAHGNTVGIDIDDNAWTIARYDWVSRKLRSFKYDKKINEKVTSVLQKTKLNCVEDREVMSKLRQIDKISANVEETRIREKILTYDDQIRIALWILQDEKVARLYRNHFFAAIVDEFQDLTPQQLRFVKALCGKNVTYAGDLSQSIYSFAGVDTALISREITNDDTTKQVKLLKSFRSAPAILNTVNSLSSLTKSEHLAAAFPEHWGDGGLSSYVSFSDQDEEAKWISKRCKLIMNACPNHRIGIISRTKFRQSIIKKTLRAQRFYFVDWSDGLFSQETARILRSICDDITDRLGESRLGERPQELHSFIQERVLRQNDISEELKDSCEWLFDQLISDSTPSKIKARINSQAGNETIVTRSGIHCLTGHTGKGQQFDWVFIVGLEEGSIPYYKNKTKEKILEEARVLSVMVSRARIGVVMTCASCNKEGFRKSPSEFLDKFKNTAHFLSDKDLIESWFANADWSAIKRM